MPAPTSASGGVLVLGASGMLGHALMHELTEHLPHLTVLGTARSLDSLPEPFRSTFASRLVDGVDVLDPVSVSSVIADLRPETVINAVGVIKQAPGVDDSVLTTQINALLPHLLARDCAAAGARLVQISTDCVFSGRAGRYTEVDLPDPVDFYGRSKLLGEVPTPHVTLRTSIIGPELRHGGSLLEWFLSPGGQAGQWLHPGHIQRRSHRGARSGHRVGRAPPTEPPPVSGTSRRSRFPSSTCLGWWRASTDGMAASNGTKPSRSIVRCQHHG